MWNWNKVLGNGKARQRVQGPATLGRKHHLEQIPNPISAKLTKQIPKIGMIPHDH
jgi:hypothetical protein